MNMDMNMGMNIDMRYEGASMIENNNRIKKSSTNIILHMINNRKYMLFIFNNLFQITNNFPPIADPHFANTTTATMTIIVTIVITTIILFLLTFFQIHDQ